MKPDDRGNQDESLRKVLQEWRSDAPLPPHFREAVWHRIERGQALASLSLSTLARHWIGGLLPRPALAVAYMAILIAIGGAAGWTQARQETTRVRDELGDRYVRVLNPYQAPRR